MSALSNLSKPQWDAALEAARELCSGNPAKEADRAAYRAAKARLVDALPADADAKAIILAAVRWDALNSIAGAFAGMPAGAVEMAQ